MSKKLASESGGVKFDSKTIAAIAALVAALAGGVELRVQVGLLASKVDRIEAELRSMHTYAQGE